MTPPLVSIIIPCYNMGGYIQEALSSIGRQNYTNWEIIVVDDCGPTDGTTAAVEDFIKQFPDHKVEYIRHDVNRGAGAAGAARNTGIRAARGELLAFLDPDDKWGENYLEVHAGALSRCSDFALSYTNAHIISATGELTSTIWGPSQSELESLPSSLYLRNFITAAVVCRRQAAEECGGFDESPDMLHADWDFLLRLLALGFRFHYAPAALFYYRKHPTGATSQHEKMRFGTIALRRKHLLYPAYRDFMAVYISEMEDRTRKLEGELALLVLPWHAMLRRKMASISPQWVKNTWRYLRAGRQSRVG
jgi:glycosyltransferase involved in cell wall biosynthesis